MHLVGASLKPLTPNGESRDHGQETTLTRRCNQSLSTRRLFSAWKTTPIVDFKGNDESKNLSPLLEASALGIPMKGRAYISDLALGCSQHTLPSRTVTGFKLSTTIMKLIVLCAVLGMAVASPAPDATAFASATSYKYPLPGGYASFSSHTPYAAAAHVATMEKEKSAEYEEKKEYEKPESAPYTFPFLKPYTMEDKDSKAPVFYTYPFQYKPGEKLPLYYVPSPIEHSDKTKEETHYESADKMEEKHEEKTPVVYMPAALPLSMDPSEKTEEKKQMYYYTFPGYTPFNTEKTDEKKFYYYPYTFPTGFKYDSSDKSDEKKVFSYSPYTFPTGFKYESSDKSDEKKPLYYYPYGFPATYKVDASEKSDEKKQIYYYPYTFPTTYKVDEKTEVKSPLVYLSSPYYYPKTETTYKFPSYTPQYYYYHSYQQ